MYLFYSIDIPTEVQVGQHLTLDEEQSAHAVRVLRYTVGDTLYVADGRGTLLTTRVVNPHPKHCEVEVLCIEPQPKHHKGNVHIAVAPTKNIDRMEWCVEKCTEIGVDTITPLLCHYSERKQIRNDRLEKIILSAAKQSLSAYLPQLREMQSFSDCVLSATEQRRYIAHSSPWTDKRDLRDELRKNPDAESTIVLIGAEGGFSDEEVRLAMEHGFIPVSLGDARLRTETAAIVACTYISAYV